MADSANWWEQYPESGAPLAGSQKPGQALAENPVTSPLKVADTPQAQVTPIADPAPSTAPNWWEAFPAAGETPPKAIAQPDPVKKLPDVGAGESFLRGAADGATFGFQDEILAGLDAAVQPLIPVPENGSSAGTWRERYDENVANQRDLLKAGSDQHPVASIAGGLVGGIAPALATGGLSTGATLAANVGRGAATGAVYGGLYGTGSAEGDLVERLPEAATGAALGAALGGAIPAVIGGAGKVVRGSANETQARLTAQQGEIQAARDAQAAANAAGGTADVVSDRAAAVQSVADAAMAPKSAQTAVVSDLAQEVAPNQQILDAAERLGVKDQLIPSQYSRSQAYREIEQALASIPGSSLNVQQKEASKALAQKADDLITQYGGSIDKAGLSDKFRKESLDAIDQVEKRSDGLYAQVSAAIPPTTPTTPDTTIAYLRQRAKDLGDPSLMSAVERRTLASLTRVDGDGITQPTTYAGLDNIRKQVGEGLRGRGPFKDSESGLLKRLYGTLSDDQHVTADAMGVGQEFTAAKALVSQRKQMEENLTDLIGKDFSGAITATIGRATNQLGKGDFKAFDKAFSKIPPMDRQQFMITALNDVFTSGSRAEQRLSAPGFVDWYDRLSRNAEAKKRLTDNLPTGAVTALDDIATVARGMREASKERITTGRLNSLKILEDYADEGGLLSKVWDVSKKVGAAEGVTSSLGLPGVGTAGVMAKVLSKEKEPINQAAEKLMGSQRFKDAIYAATNTNGAQIGRMQAKEAQLMRTLAYKNWYANLGENAKAQISAVGPVTYLTTSAKPEPIELPPTTVKP
ncbi:hypothetical protein [Pseudomonas syringae]|uniref:hypothetical protein n=1 Tax=Pseudomonas syringae TaxID=317 RepID=UPI001F0F661C|nr:hypothetical protein [Pseudomonas syringae]MCH5583105.1 hypothetical protein [Pseudomonas syringae pv. syringae]MCH5592796.1 hypothetical protein [Pseudomonas syringae pv. syringae]MDF5791047.1 hypothetical protein [Pseudomonas syringae pv. syringae]